MMNKPTMIIDSHVHFPVGLPDDGGARILHAAARCGIGMVIASNLAPGHEYSAAPDSRALRIANMYAANQSALHRGRLFFLGYINPQLPDWYDEADFCIRHGAVGLKLWINLKDAQGSLDNTRAVLGEAALRQAPVLLHTFDRTAGNLSGEITFAEFLKLARAIPDCTMIAAHLSANIRQNRPLLRRLPSNVYVDISGCAPERGALDSLLTQLDPERILFGSDAMGRSFASQLSKVTESGADAESRHFICCENARRVFRIKDPIPELSCPAAPAWQIWDDHEVFCGNWPFDPSWSCSPGELDAKLAECGTRFGYAVRFDCIFARDKTTANRRALESAERLRHVRLLPVVDPTEVNGTEVLKEALSSEAPGVWMSPFFHRWQLDDERFLLAAKRCATCARTLYLNLGFGDERFHPADFAHRVVPPQEFQRFLRNIPACRIVLQGIRIAPDELPSNVRVTAPRLTDYQDFPVAGALPGSEFPVRTLTQVRRIYENCCTEPNS